MKHLKPLILMLLLSISSITQAQSCSALVSEVFEVVGDNCNGLSGNSVCYGFSSLTATLDQNVASDSFDEATERISVASLETLVTESMNPDTNEWGIAVMNVQANIPDTLPGQYVTFFLIGDTQITNEVDGDHADLISITIQTTDVANLRHRPTTESRVIGSLEASSDLVVDAISNDGIWLRTVFNNQLAWVRTDLVRSEQDISTLPSIEDIPQTPMQAFSLTTGIGNPSCNDYAPSSVIIQGPNNITIDIQVNGIDISIGSTIMLAIDAAGNLQIITLSGTALLNGGALAVPAGFTASTPLDANGIASSGEWGGMRTLNEVELANIQFVEFLPSSLMNYSFASPTQEQIDEFITSIIPPTPEPVITTNTSSESNEQSSDTSSGDTNNNASNNGSDGNGNNGNNGNGNGNGK